MATTEVNTTSGMIDLGAIVREADALLDQWDDSLIVEVLQLLKDRLGKAESITIGSSVVSREDLQNEISDRTNGTNQAPQINQDTKERISDAVKALQNLKFMLPADLRAQANDVLKRREAMPRIRVTKSSSES